MDNKIYFEIEQKFYGDCLYGDSTWCIICDNDDIIFDKTGEPLPPELPSDNVIDFMKKSGIYFNYLGDSTFIIENDDDVEKLKNLIDEYNSKIE